MQIASDQNQEKLLINNSHNPILSFIHDQTRNGDILVLFLVLYEIVGVYVYKHDSIVLLLQPQCLEEYQMHIHITRCVFTINILVFFIESNILLLPVRLLRGQTHSLIGLYSFPAY